MNRQIRIGTTTFGCDGGRSGIGQYLLNLLREFERYEATSQIELLALESERKIYEVGSTRNSFVTFGKMIARSSANLLWHQVGLPYWARRQKYDVLFLPAANRRLPFRAPCPTVGTVHDFSSLHVSGKYSLAHDLYIKRIIPWLVRKLDYVLTVSESSKRDIVNFAKVPEERVLVTPLGVDHAKYYPGDHEAEAEFVEQKYGLSQPFLLYVSRLEHPGKNHVRLIEAFDLMKQDVNSPHQLVFVGSDWTRSEEIRAAAAKSRFAKDIVFLGFTPHEDLPSLYRAAESFIFPSLFEGFGLPILEAMACGTPVACANVSSLPEVAGDAALMFDPKSVEEISESLVRLVLDWSLRDELIAKGLKQASRFRWEQTAWETMRALAQVAEKDFAYPRPVPQCFSERIDQLSQQSFASLS